MNWPTPPDTTTPALSCVPLFRANHAHMRGDDEPAVGETDPGLHLPADLTRHGGAVEQGRGDRKIAAIGGDDGVRESPRQAGRRTRGAERLDLVIAEQIFGATETDGA